MSRIMQAWEDLLREAVDRDEDTRQYAALRIALILERHYQPNQDAPTLYEDHLSRELQRLTLSESRQRDALQYLLQLATNNKEMADAFLYGVAVANPEIALPLVSSWLKNNAKDLSDTSAYQLVVFLRRIKRREDKALWQTISQETFWQDLLKQWATSEDDDLAQSAKSLLA
jgi:hemerythrin-like domain-containing protein